MSDTFLVFLAGLGIGVVARRRTGSWDMPAVRLASLAFAIPGLVMLMAVAATFRYRAEFYQLIGFLALFGQAVLVRWMEARPGFWRKSCIAMIVVSMVGAFTGLISYKIAPWDDAQPIEAIGWRAAYQDYFRDTYPSIDHLIRAWLGSP